jgi:hypothetical protein
MHFFCERTFYVYFHFLPHFVHISDQLLHYFNHSLLIIALSIVMMETDLSQNKEFMDLYSRQIGAYGIETMGRLVNMRVVLVGLQGVGVETAKNLILAGPGTVVLCDDHPTEVITPPSPAPVHKSP